MKNTFSRNDLIGVPDRYSRHGDGDDLFHESPPGGVRRGCGICAHDPGPLHDPGAAAGNVIVGRFP